MFLRIFILFFISLSLNAAEVVWDQESAKKVKKISDSEYQSVLDGYLNGLAKNPEKAFERGVEAEKHKHYESALYLYRLSASQNFLPAQHNLAYMYANNLGITKKDSESIKTKVSQAQVILSKLDYDVKNTNGIYSLQTFNAVKSFQKNIGIAQTGWVDQKLLDELKKSEIEADKQADTLKTQQLLNKLGYYLGSLDGNFGPATAHAIKSYQRDNAKTQDSKVSNNLIVALEKSYQQYLKELKNNKNLTLENFNAGFKAYKSGNYEKAARLYKLSANQGNANAQYNLGLMYYYGQGVKQDYQEAERLFKLSADQGDAIAQNYLGVLYDSGQGVKQDYQEAARLFKLSANQGNTTAQFNLGLMYYYGEGVKQDYQEAARLFKLSADQGNIIAKNNLESLCKARPSVCR